METKKSVCAQYGYKWNISTVVTDTVVTSCDEDIYEQSMQVLVHYWQKYIAEYDEK